MSKERTAIAALSHHNTVVSTLDLPELDMSRSLENQSIFEQ